MIQGGSPKCDQQGGAGTSVNGEVPTDNYPIGSLAAAKGGSDPAGTFDAQFFIVTGSQGATLPNDYARFGSVISGLDVAQKIEGLPTQPNSERHREQDQDQADPHHVEQQGARHQLHHRGRGAHDLDHETRDAVARGFGRAISGYGRVNPVDPALWVADCRRCTP